MEPHGQGRGPRKTYPPPPLGAKALPPSRSPLRRAQGGRCASGKASLGHPPISEIRRSMIESSFTETLSGVTDSSTAKAVVSCVGGRESLEIFFAGFDLDLQDVFSWRENTDEFLIVGTGGMIGPIEI